jgi:hypothetical protein
MKLRREVDLQTFREVTKEMDAALDQLDREHKSLTSEAAMPELPDPSLSWEDLSAVDRRALTEMLVDKIIIQRHPSKIDKDGRRHYLIRAIPYQDPQQEAERLKAVHEARVKIVPKGLSSVGEPIASWVPRPRLRISTPTTASKATSRPMNSNWFGATTARHAVVTQPKCAWSAKPASAGPGGRLLYPG